MLTFASSRRFLRHHGRVTKVGLAVVVVSVLSSSAIVIDINGSGHMARYLWRAGYHDAAYYTNNADPALALQEGFYYFGGGAYDLSRAKTSYQLAADLTRTQDASTLSPALQFADYQLARIYFVQGNFKSALSEIDTTLSRFPYNKRALYIRGLIYLYRGYSGDLQLAANDFSDFTKWAPTEWAGYNDLAFTLAREGKYEESAQVIHVAFTNVPNAGNNPWLWNSLGLAELNQGKYAAAATAFARAIPLVETLTTEEWVRAYSADDPAAASASMAAFLSAAKSNLKMAEAG